MRKKILQNRKFKDIDFFQLKIIKKLRKKGEICEMVWRKEKNAGTEKFII